MNVLSLFDGMSCCQIALNRIGIKPAKYYAAELDKYAITVTQANYPDTIQLGDVIKWREWNIDWASINLVSAGFPCQSWSVAGQQLGDKDERGMLFWTTLEIIAEVLKHNPKAKFLMENVKMKKEFEEYITHHTTEALSLVEKTLINSALVSAQNRNRYYWTNFKVEQPQDKGVLLRDILEETNNELRPCERIKEGNEGHITNATDIKGMDCIKRVYGQDGKAPTLTTMGGGHREPKVLINESRRQLVFCGAMRGRYVVDGKHQDHKQLTAGLTKQRIEVRYDEKTNALTTVGKDNVVVYGADGTPYYDLSEISYRKLTPIECERLQTIPDGYSAHVSNTQRYRMLGNGFTVEVISRILSCNDWTV